MRGYTDQVGFQAAESNEKVESLLRTTCIELGLAAAIAGRPITGDVVKKLTVPNTLSQAWYLGRAVHLARREKTDLINAIVGFIILLFEFLVALADSSLSSIPHPADFSTAAK
jgi:DUF917 family protein